MKQQNDSQRHFNESLLFYLPCCLVIFRQLNRILIGMKTSLLPKESKNVVMYRHLQ